MWLWCMTAEPAGNLPSVVPEKAIQRLVSLCFKITRGHQEQLLSRLQPLQQISKARAREAVCAAETWREQHHKQDREERQDRNLEGPEL